MIELVTLGRIALHGPETTSPERVIAQPKRLALLCYLALAGRGGVQSRESVLVLLWPDGSRDTLRQALRYLRSALGSEVIRSEGTNWLGADPQQLRVDAWEFERLLREKKPAEALALYGGPLLEGLEAAIGEAPEFEQWLRLERARLHRLAVDAAWGLAEDARDEDDTAGALRWARRAADLAPEDEEGLRRLIGILAWTGDRGAALHAYETFAERLREHLGVEVSKQTQDLLARVLRAAPGHTSIGIPVSISPPTQEQDSGSTERADPVAAGIGAEHPGDPASPRIGGEAASSIAHAPGEASRRRHPRRAGVRMLLALVAAIAIVATAMATGSRSWSVEADPAEDVVAILPFRVGGAASDLHYLQEGMVDLLGAHYTGEVGPRAIATRTVLRAWERITESDTDPPSPREVSRFARQLGAGRILSGDVVGDGRRVVIHAELRSIDRGQTIRASVHGPTDSVYALVGTLANRLHALEQGEAPRRVSALQDVSPEAVRAYLRGQQHYRASGYEEANRQFEQALQVDSTFALAALGLVQTRLGAPWIRGHVFESAIPIAWRLRDRLGPADRRFVTATAGPNYPIFSGGVDAVSAWDQAVAAAPDSPETWYQFGDALFHWGRPLGMPDHEGRAAAAFERALALDSSYTAPLFHLVELTATHGDTADARRYGAWYLRESPDADAAAYIRWRMATVAEDRRALQHFWARPNGMPLESLFGILKAAQMEPRFIGDAERVARMLRQRALTPSERWQTNQYLHALALNRGDLEEVQRLTEGLEDVVVWPRHHLRTQISSALFAGGDRRAAERAVDVLSSNLDGPFAKGGTERRAQVADLCTVQFWKLWHGDVATARPALERLRAGASGGEDPGAVAERMNCAAFLEMLHARAVGSKDLAKTTARFAVLYGSAAALPSPMSGDNSVTIAFARVLEQQGDAAGALRIIRSWRTPPVQYAAILREQGRLAALVGDTAQAERAYEHFLLLRSTPHLTLTGEAQEVRRELASLERSHDGVRARGVQAR